MNKPVAWMNKDVKSWLSCTNQHPETEIDEWLPLYTHPVKELTDEEIYELFENSYFKVYAEDSDLSFPRLDPIYFAKAILRKAQEK